MTAARLSVSTHEMRMLAGILQTHAVDCHVLAFGSRTKDKAKPYSDLDLAFVQKDGARLGMSRIATLRLAFSESDIPYVVDVVDYNAASPACQAMIDAASIVLQTAHMSLWCLREP
jgi:predicted nucleotidyltransferase